MDGVGMAQAGPGTTWNRQDIDSDSIYMQINKLADLD